MACRHCGGLTIVEEFLEENGSRTGFEAERCLNCGHREDIVILVNRGNRLVSSK